MNNTLVTSIVHEKSRSGPSTIKLVILTFAVLFIISLFWPAGNATRATRRCLNLPGPQGLPLFGNIFELRTGHAAVFKAWARQYGDIFRMVLGNKEVVVLNSREAVAKTLIRQGATYMGRPELKELSHESSFHESDTIGVSTIGTTQWNGDLSKIRKLLGPHTNARKLPKYNHFASGRYLNMVKMLAESVSKPKDLGYCWWSTAMGLVTDQVVGQTHDEKFVRQLCETEIGLVKLRALGHPLSDWVPIVQVAKFATSKLAAKVRAFIKGVGMSIPELLADTEGKRCEALRATQTRYCKEQLRSLLERITKGDTTPSQLGDLFRALPEPLSERDQYQLILTLSGSGMPIGTLLTWLIGYMASHPELQDKAFHAIQEVYNGEVPDPHDTDRVEYIKALATEAGRYWTIVRLGLLRETFNDSQLDNAFIPQGTIVVFNSFQINRDPVAYDYPEKFIPERWLNGHQGRTDVSGIVGAKIGVPHMSHGTGRRFCPGVPNVNKSLYGILSLALHFFKFERAELNDEELRDVFPLFRACRQTTVEMHPIHDQVSTSERQAVPCATGIRVLPRNPGQLASWLSEGHQTLGDFMAPCN